jgi:hypothetical protein
MLSMKNHVREALFTAALFGLGTAFAQSPSPSPNSANNSGNIESAQSPKVPGAAGVEEPTVKQAPGPGAASAVFVNGTLNVPNAPKETATTPAKFSAANAKLDEAPIMARGPVLTDAQRKLILEHVKSAGTAAPMPATPMPYAGPTTQLPATAAMQPWPSDVVSQVPSLRGTKYVAIPGKVLLVRPDNAIVVGEIDR